MLQLKIKPKRDILTRKVGIANVINTCLRPKQRTTNTIKNLLIAPLKAVTSLPFAPKSKIRPTPYPAQNKLVSPYGPTGRNTGIFHAFIPPPGPQIK
jgi:hypothetical protein